MKYCVKVEDLNVTDFTSSKEIFSLQLRTEGSTKWIVINYTKLFKYSDWTIAEAIEHHLSEEGYIERKECAKWLYMHDMY